jgi:hypothetical protein
MTFRFSLTVIAAAFLTSCSTPGTPDPSPVMPGVAAGNPLLGSWKFDSSKSVVHTVAYSANSGSLGTSNDKTRELVKLSEGSTVSFTANTITMTLADGRSTSMEYSVKSQDGNGNVTIVNPQGQESAYSVSGNKLISSVPEMNFVAVYVR